MKKSVNVASLAALVAATAVSGTALGQVQVIRGADSMESLTQQLLLGHLPVPAPGGDYVPTFAGTLRGERAMQPNSVPEQGGLMEIAPMSRFLQEVVYPPAVGLADDWTNLTPANYPNGNGLAVAVDQIVLASGERATEIGDVDDLPGTLPEDQGASLAYNRTIDVPANIIRGGIYGGNGGETLPPRLPIEILAGEPGHDNAAFSYVLDSSGPYSGGIDLLRVLFAGADHDLNSGEQVHPTPDYAGKSPADLLDNTTGSDTNGCNSPLRNYLQQNYNEILQNPVLAADGANSCGAFWRDTSDGGRNRFIYQAPVSPGVAGDPDIVNGLENPADYSKFMTVEGTYTRAGLGGSNAGTMNLVGQHSSLVSTTAPAVVDASVFPFEAGQFSAGQHLFRGGDFSGATETFIKVLGLAPIEFNSPFDGAGGVTDGNSKYSPFCNGVAGQDIDPIRVACTPEMDVCQGNPVAEEQLDRWNGTLGWLTAVVVPGSREDFSDDEIYPTGMCSLASNQRLGVDLGHHPITGFFDTACPDGSKTNSGQCLHPELVGSSGNVFCTAQSNNTNGTCSGSKLCDGRGWNIVPRRANGDELLNSSGHWMERGYHLLSVRDETADNIVFRSGVERDCREASASRQIGCLAGLLECSMGFASKESILPFGSANPYIQTADFDAVPYALNDTDPALPNFPKFLSGQEQTVVSANYPLNRKLFYNSLVGTENLTGLDDDLVNALKLNPETTAGWAAAHGYHPLSRVLCQSYGDGTSNCLMSVAEVDLDELSIVKDTVIIPAEGDIPAGTF